MTLQDRLRAKSSGEKPVASPSSKPELHLSQFAFLGSSARCSNQLLELLQRRLLATGDLDVEDPGQQSMQSARALVAALFETLGGDPEFQALPGFAADYARLCQSRDDFFDHVVGDLFGLGPLAPLLSDPQVTQIMVNGAGAVFYDKRGLRRHLRTFSNEAHLLAVVQRLLARSGRSIGPEDPVIRTRLPDGSYLVAAVPPVASEGTCLTIHKRPHKPPCMEDLLARGMLSAPLAIFLNACLRARLNIVVAGAPGSGKTTLLGALLGFIPEQERAVIIEHRAELAPTLKNRVLLEALDTGGRQGPSARQLMALALEMRPDRLVLGECRGAEAFDLLQAICTGLDGCLMTIHALSPHDLTQRLELMAALAGHALARSSIAQMIGSSFQVMVQTERVGDGSRKVTKAVALEALADGTIHFSDIFTFDAAAEGGKGRHRATGVRPWFGERLERSGVPLPPRLYES